MGGAESKTNVSLAEKRYKISSPKVNRRSTARKLGSIAIYNDANTGTSSNPLSQSISTINYFKDMRNNEEENGEDEVNSENGDSDEKRLLNDDTSKKVSWEQIALKGIQLTRTESSANATIMLTRTQRVLIENNWKRIRKNSSDGVGSRIFYAVLTAQPDIKILFGVEKVPQGRLKYDNNFRKHCSLLNKELEYIVKNLSYTDKLSSHFQNLGKKHCLIHSGRAFPSQYWDTFAECIIQSAIGADGVGTPGRSHRCSRETAIAWRNLTAFIISEMRRGFDNERLLRKRFSASIMGLPSSSRKSLTNKSSAQMIEDHEAIGRRRSGVAGSRSYRNLGDCRGGSLTSLELPTRNRAASAISPLVEENYDGSETIKAATGRYSISKKGVPPPPLISRPSFTSSTTLSSSRLAPSVASSNSARSASWCEAVAAQQLARLELIPGGTTQKARSECTFFEHQQTPSDEYNRGKIRGASEPAVTGAVQRAQRVPRMLPAMPDGSTAKRNNSEAFRFHLINEEGKEYHHGNNEKSQENRRNYNMNANRSEDTNEQESRFGEPIRAQPHPRHSFSNFENHGKTSDDMQIGRGETSLLLPNTDSGQVRRLSAL